VRSVSRGRLILALVLAVLATAAVSVLAQLSHDPTWRPHIWDGGRRVHRTPPKWA
jgi:hypothetical protein